MGVNRGKFFDARLTAEYFDGMKSSVSEYANGASDAHMSFAIFRNEPTFQGKTATSTKEFINGAVGGMLTELTDVKDQMVRNQNYIMEAFGRIVDSSRNARIEFDTLERLNSDFKGFYRAFVDHAKEVDRLVDGLNSEFGSYAYFEKPNKSSAISGFETICGGDSEGSGHFRRCQNKLAEFDDAMRSYLRGTDVVDHTNTMDRRINNAASVRGSFKQQETQLNNIQVEHVLYNGNEAVAAGAGVAASMEGMLENSKTLKVDFLSGLKGITTPYHNIYVNPRELAKIAKKVGSSVEELWDFIIQRHVPQDWSNQKLLIVLYMLSQFRAVSVFQSSLHEKNNKKEIADVYIPGEYIEYQYKWDKVLYGERIWEDSGTMAYSGCEILAVVNAYHAMGKDLTVDEVAGLIKNFEGRGATLYGTFGTSPTVLLEYLTSQGYETQVAQSENYVEIEKIAQTSDTMIVTVYNDENDLTQMIHTVNVEKIDNGDGTFSYITHNAGDANAYATAEEAIEHIGYDGKTKVIQVIGVSDTTS